MLIIELILRKAIYHLQNCAPWPWLFLVTAQLMRLMNTSKITCCALAPVTAVLLCLLLLLFFFQLIAFFFFFVDTRHWHCLSLWIRRRIPIGSNYRWCRICCGYHVKESGLRTCPRAINDLHPPFRLLRLVQHDRWTPTPTLNKKQIFS
jgi:hypothetical protein